MDIRQLRYFLQICRDGRITTAADNLFITQQALSKALRTLESEIGTLFVRKAGVGMTLTPKGELLRSEAPAILERFDALVDKLRQCGEPGSHLHLIAPYCSVYKLQPVIDAFCAQHTDITIQVDEMADIEAEEALLDSQYDFGFCVDHPINANAFDCQPLFTRPLCLMVPEEDPLSRREAIDLIRDIEPSRLACANQHFKIFHMLKRIYENNGIKPDFQLINDQYSSYSKALVGKSLSISFADVPEAHAFKSLYPIPFCGEQPAWVVQMIRRRDKPLSCAAALLWEDLQAAFCSTTNESR